MAGLTKNFALKKPKSRKRDMVASIQQKFNEASVSVLVEYRSLSMSDLTKIRRELHKEQATFTVVKNTLAKRAISGNSEAVLNDAFKGPIAVIFGRADQVAPVKTYARLMKEMKKETAIQAGYLDGQFLSAADVENLVSLPPLNELRAKLLGGIASPVNGLVAAISGPQRSLVNVLDQLAKQKAS